MLISNIHMERRMSLAAGAATTILIVALMAPSSCSAAERDNHGCGRYANGTWEFCDSGRCCSVELYCGDGDDYCGKDRCWYQCPLPSGNYGHQSNYQVAETGGAGVLVATPTRLVNATRNNQYLNLNLGGGGGDDHDELVKVVANDNASSSSPP
ncbi:unnamed protein product [Linum tenue]|uniref:Chitin-binding type-1 domain-containing protein n=1 Tax=Linum tenue TaxID=586396 RepID=A0AAV0JK10_9ROSI|nr:unnamed protein product [Linum tenue]